MLINLSQTVALELDPRFTTLKQLPDTQDREDMGATWGRGSNFGEGILWERNQEWRTYVQCSVLLVQLKSLKSLK